MTNSAVVLTHSLCTAHNGSGVWLFRSWQLALTVATTTTKLLRAAAYNGLLCPVFVCNSS